MIKKYFKNLIFQKRYPLAHIHSSAAIDTTSQIAEYVVLFKNARIVGSCIGRYAYLQENAFIFNADIGAFGSIGANVSIGLVNHPIDMVSTSPVFYDNSQPLPKFFTQVSIGHKKFKKTLIGADVWIGDGVKIIEGVEVGVGAVLGAGSVVTKNIPPYAIAVGNPCRIIRSRFSEVACSGLLASEWWKMPDEKLLQLAPFFHDPDLFLSELGNI